MSRIIVRTRRFNTEYYHSHYVLIDVCFPFRCAGGVNICSTLLVARSMYKIPFQGCSTSLLLRPSLVHGTPQQVQATRTRANSTSYENCAVQQPIVPYSLLVAYMEWASACIDERKRCVTPAKVVLPSFGTFARLRLVYYFIESSIGSTPTAVTTPSDNQSNPSDVKARPACMQWSCLPLLLPPNCCIAIEYTRPRLPPMLLPNCTLCLS